MPLTRKALLLSFGMLGMLSAATIGQSPRSSSADTQLTDVEAHVDWFQKSDISALREGVIEHMELRIGKEVGKKGDVIGYLHKEVADLAVKEAEIQAKARGAIEKAQAQRKLALSVVARNVRLINQKPDYVSREDFEKAEAELAAADASLIEARETQDLAKAKLESAKQAAEEHIIRAPFSGKILEEFKHEGESVRANEPVVRLGNLDTVRVWAYIPVQYALRVKPGTEVMIQIRLDKESTGKHPIEQKQFRGAISAVDDSIQGVGETTVRIYADLDNPDHELKPGYKAVMTIALKPETGTSYASPGPRNNQASSTIPSVGARPLDLPPLPR
jgi:RND family efflux transporter MFP subunit